MEQMDNKWGTNRFFKIKTIRLLMKKNYEFTPSFLKYIII